MQKYKEFQPTGFDRKGAFLYDQQGWLVVPVFQNRDSGPLERSNFEVAINMLGGESETVEVHRFGHWGTGWFEIIIIDPTDKNIVVVAEEIESSLANYPVLDEMHHSEIEFNEMHEVWDMLLLCEKIQICHECGHSIFAARHETIPENVYAEHLGIY